MIVRRFVFWLHLLTGITAGSVILVMSATGVVLTCEPQMVDYAERSLRTVPPPLAGAARVSLGNLVAAAQDARGGERASTVTFGSEPRSSVRVGFGREATLFVHPFTGAVISPGSRTHTVLHVVEDWHRWLGSRDLGRPFTGACNLAFLGLGISGLFLWWPRAWSRRAMRAITVPDLRLRGKARDFNWHNSIGFWCAPVIIVITLTGAVMSYQWANDLLYRVTGNTPPPVAGGGGAGVGAARAGRPEGREKSGAAPSIDLDALATRAAGQVPSWVAITLRLPQRPGGPVIAFIQEPPTWHPNPRSVLTLDAATAQVVRWEPFAGANLGRKLRVLVRVLHTGEVGGVIGQGIAGLASVGGVFPVSTGIAQACRRARAWSVRRRVAAGRDLADASTAPTS
ncbi:MAG TPA: PepSY-associated TM helix domain-containing protein [Patescibacteria group bacterium]|nr:PepSY-associated TM helix domain-containing protein [Patescibacteria group bacterium]